MQIESLDLIIAYNKKVFSDILFRIVRVGSVPLAGKDGNLQNFKGFRKRNLAKKMVIEESILVQPRMSKLKLKEVSERRLNGQRTNNVYLYKFVLVTEQTRDVSELNVVDGISHDESTIATMFGRSSLRFTGSEILGLTSRSFEVNCDRTTQRKNLSDRNQCPNSFEITADLITNSIEFRYFITGSLDGLEIKFESIMKNKVNIDSIKNMNVEMNAVKVEIQEVGITLMGAMCTCLHKGYN